MGWDSCEAWKSASEALASVDADRADWKRLDRAVVANGSRVWTVYESEGVRFIVCDLFERDGHGSGRSWMTKSIPTNAGPRYYDCPLAFLDYVKPSNSYDYAWRAEVRIRARLSRIGTAS
jgi:hypothetical protein